MSDVNLGAFPARNSDIIARYRHGVATLGEIGLVYGITRERVRQIVCRAGVPRRSPVPCRVRLITCACSVCGFERSLLPSEATKYCSYQCSGIGRRRRSDSDMAEQLATLAVTLGRTPTRQDILATPGLADPMTYYRRFGSLRAAQVAAGLEPNPLGRPGHLAERDK